MEDLHEGANVLLAYWHYYRTDEDPLEVDPIDRHRSRLADLGAEQFSFVKKSCAVMREKSKSTIFRRSLLLCASSLLPVSGTIASASVLTVRQERSLDAIRIGTMSFTGCAECSIRFGRRESLLDHEGQGSGRSF